MKSNQKKILVIGVDQSIIYLIRKFTSEQILPNIYQLMNDGVFAEGFSCPPCDTPTNWTTIATGATTAVHGCTSFYLHIPGEPFSKALDLRSRSQLSKHCQAEYIWDVADKEGLRTFVINYPSGWPKEFKNGIMSLFSWPIPNPLPRMIGTPKTYTFKRGSKRKKSQIVENPQLEKKFQCHNPPLKVTMELDSKSITKTGYLDAYMIDKEGEEYDTLIIKTNSDKEYVISKNNEWSDWISIDLETDYGNLKALFKIHLQEIATNGEKLKLKRTALYNTKGWIKPELVGEEFIREVMDYEVTFEEKKVEYMISGRTNMFLKNSKRVTDTIGQSILWAKNKINWDLCFFHIHHLDSVNHRYLAQVYEKSDVYTEESAEKAMDRIRAAYKIVDDLVGQLLTTCVDENTIVCFITDHGAIPTWKMANIPMAFVRSGLLSYKWDHNDRKFNLNMKDTLAFPYLEPNYVWVNLKGRDPQGIVNQSEYESVRDRIIDTLYQMRDPETGQRIIKLALRKEDADFLGQNGERVGDVVYFVNAPYSLFDGGLWQLNPAEANPIQFTKSEVYEPVVNFGAHAYYLPTEKVGEYSVSVPIIISGPGIKKDIEIKKPVNLIDFAPTISHLLGIPRPKDSSGRVLYELFE
ncbi:MAG: hypothetical protein GF329_08520 [Candidatus Lokiarchaeota archaeon]|nr:hypothetical protein [Candidatus Lokiarchaeota archaeon]